MAVFLVTLTSIAWAIAVNVIMFPLLERQHIALQIDRKISHYDCLKENKNIQVHSISLNNQPGFTSIDWLWSDPICTGK